MRSCGTWRYRIHGDRALAGQKLRHHPSSSHHLGGFEFAVDAKMAQTLSDFAPFFTQWNHNFMIPREFLGRGKRIRTSGPCVPNAVLYQAELFPDTFCCSFLLLCEARNYISVFAELQSPIIVAALP